MGVLFLLGAIITLGLKLIQDFQSGLVVGLVGGLINGLVYGNLVRRFLVQNVDKTSDDKPKLDRFGIIVGIEVTTATAFFYTWVFWLFFGGNLIIIILAGSFIGFIGGVGGGLSLWITPLLEWRVYHVPGRQLGYFGLSMLVLGFIIQTLQYLIIVFDIPVK